MYCVNAVNAASFAFSSVITLLTNVYAAKLLIIFDISYGPGGLDMVTIQVAGKIHLLCVPTRGHPVFPSGPVRKGRQESFRLKNYCTLVLS